jgi:elongation factor P hydroxylase
MIWQLQMFNKKNNEKAKQYVEYGLSEYAKVFIKSLYRR